MGRLGPGWLNRIRAAVGGPTRRRLGQWALEVDRVGRLEGRFRALSDAALRKHSLDLRWRARGGEPLPRILPEAFALVREAAQRSIGLRHYDVQLLGGIALNERCVVEMEAGEGKTLVATLPAYLNALTGQGVHIVTVNDYLAGRDAEWMGPVYRMLGLSVGCIQTPMGRSQRRKSYGCDVTYGTAKEFGFDFLRDRLLAGGAGGGERMWTVLFGQGARRETPVQRAHHYAIVDEADSILIDEARTPLIISAPPTEEDRREAEAYRWAHEAAAELQENIHYTYDHDERRVELTDEGRWKVRAMPMPDALGPVGLEEIYEHAERAVKVGREFHRDRQYVVVDDEIVIVDEFTGRMQPGRKWRDGIHQAIEAKEGVPVTVATGLAARTTIQNYFRRYGKLAGMTGTAWSGRRELRRIYRMPVVVVPTNRPLRRVFLLDRVFAREEEKWRAIVEEICRLNATGRPVLIGTRSIDKSEHLSQLLARRNVPH
ncbi:MAG: preprotein translocase subunit SecA, partial [Pirellulales bacterium]